MNLLKQALEDSKNNKSLISLCESIFDEDGLTGIVTEYNDEMVGLIYFTKYGEFDGYLYTLVDYIVDAKYDDANTESIATLVKENKSKKNIDIETFGIEGLLDTRKHILQKIIDRKEIVSVEISGDEIFMRLIDIDEDYIKFYPIDSSGNTNGIRITAYSSIDQIRYRDTATRDVVLLNKLKSKNGK
jgi:hypothetical protein